MTITSKTLCGLSAALWISACATIDPTQTQQTTAPESDVSASDSTARNSQSGKPFMSRTDVQAFLRDMVTQQGFNAAALNTLFRQVVIKPEIITAMTRPSEAKPWHAYQPQFVAAKRIEGGVAFWRTHAETLARAEQLYGVPPEIILAIIGVETQYGGNMGKYRVIDALSTLAFDYPRRAAYFRKELESFLVLTRTERIDPLSLRGSYAGAMGYGQFMPSSFLKLAVDFDGDGRRDLLKSPRDAIGSVANYFQQNGWRRGQPVAVRASVSEDVSTLVDRTLVPPQRHISDWKTQGVLPKEPIDDAQSALLLELKGRDGPEYWLGCDNFYAITRYNRSISYAMAVYQLSVAIRARYAAQ